MPAWFLGLPVWIQCNIRTRKFVCFSLSLSLFLFLFDAFYFRSIFPGKIVSRWRIAIIYFSKHVAPVKYKSSAIRRAKIIPLSMFYNRGNEIYKVDFKFEYFSRLEGTVTFFFFYFLLCGQLNGSKRIELIETAWEKRMIAVHVLQKKKKEKKPCVVSSCSRKYL